ncbi:MAG: PaaI family thioesterase [Deltaproteobacteria bacterium]|nr:PaaI family thioesterase [Deltaproteobacteria bacterium]
MTGKSAATQSPLELSQTPLSLHYEHRRHSHCHCILCGLANPASLRLKFSKADDGSVHTTFRGNALLQGYTGILHGGIISSLLDAAMTHCLFHRNIEAVTGDLNVRFFHPVPCDAQLEIHAQVVSAHGILYRLESVIVHNNQKLAKASARFMIPKDARVKSR